MADVTLETRLIGDSSDLMRALQQGVTAGDKFDKGIKKSAGGADTAMKTSGGSIMGTMKKIAGAAIAYFSIRAIAQFASGVIDAASDLQEAGTAVQEVFGDGYSTVRKFAEDAANSLGQSTLQALDAAKTFGVYGSAAGLAGEENAKFSTGLVTMASDLASFHNADPSDVIEAIGSGLRGEAVPLRKFGILLNEATLQTEAMKLGIYDGNGALTSQQKIMAANSAIMSQAGAATGDFARTQFGLANQQRILSANFTDFKASLGSVFLPLVQAGALVLNTTLMPALKSLAEFLQGKIGPAMEGFGEKAGPMLSGVGGKASEFFASVVEKAQPFIDAFMGLIPVVSPVIDLVLELATSFSPLMAIFDNSSSILPVVVGIITQLAGILTEILPSVIELGAAFGDAFVEVLGIVLPLIGSMIPMVGELLGALVPLIDPILGIVMALLPVVAVIGTLIGAILPPLISLLLAVVVPIVNMLTPALDFVAFVIGIVVTAIAGFIGWLIDLEKEAAKNGTGIGRTFEIMGDVIGAIFNGIGIFIGFLVDAFKKNFNTIVTMVKFVGGVFSSIFGAIGGFISGAFTTAVGVVKNGVNGIIGLVNGAIASINRLKVTIPDWVPKLGGMTFGLNLPSIPKLATGGTITSSGMAWVGERGPELVNLPRGASVIPNKQSMKMSADSSNRSDDSGPMDLSDESIDKLARALSGYNRQRGRQGDE